MAEDDFFEVLNLDELLSNDDILEDFPHLQSGGEEEYGEEREEGHDPIVDPFLFLHPTYYSFKQGLGNYLVEWSKGRVEVSTDIIIALDSNFVR
jgi:hypothetical protein